MMNHLLSRQTLLRSVTNAIADEEKYLALRNFIFSYYSGDTDYVFESSEIETAFAVLASYFEFEEAFGDPKRLQRLRRLQQVLQKDASPESVLVALEYENVSALSEKLRTAVISEFTFQSQLRKLSRVKVNWKKVLEFHDSHPELGQA